MIFGACEYFRKIAGLRESMRRLAFVCYESDQLTTIIEERIKIKDIVECSIKQDKSLSNDIVEFKNV